MVGTAFAVITDTSDPFPRDGRSHEERTLGEVPAAASGRPGEIAPPCPDVATVTRLKQARIPSGPATSWRRTARPYGSRLPRRGEAGRGRLYRADRQGGPEVELPCGRGAKIMESAIVEVDGRYCARITYIAETGSPPRTETLCVGDVPSVGGEPGPVRPTAGRDAPGRIRTCLQIRPFLPPRTAPGTAPFVRERPRSSRLSRR